MRRRTWRNGLATPFIGARRHNRVYALTGFIEQNGDPDHNARACEGDDRWGGGTA
jgi:hypothetical protein